LASNRVFFFCWARFFARPRAKKPGFPLQFLVRASHALRDFRFNPSRAQGLFASPHNPPRFACLFPKQGSGVCFFTLKISPNPREACLRTCRFLNKPNL
jgi:hypothetical protein